MYQVDAESVEAIEDVISGLRSALGRRANESGPLVLDNESGDKV